MIKIIISENISSIFFFLNSQNYIGYTYIFGYAHIICYTYLRAKVGSVLFRFGDHQIVIVKSHTKFSLKSNFFKINTNKKFEKLFPGL